MQRKMTASFIQEVRDLYTPGTKVRLIQMNDVQAPPAGTIGVVEHIDDIGTIHVKWETGSTLGVVWGEDKIALVDKVVTVCDGKRTVWEHREDAIRFYAKKLADGAGSVQRKYFNVLCSLFLDLIICTDKN